MITCCNLLFMDDWAIRAKAAMKEKGITQAKLAEKFGNTQGAIAHWLKGKREISLADFIKLAKYIGEQPEYLLNGAKTLRLINSYQESAATLNLVASEPPPEDERELLLGYRNAEPTVKEIMLDAARRATKKQDFSKRSETQ